MTYRLSLSSQRRVAGISYWSSPESHSKSPEIASDDDPRKNPALSCWKSPLEATGSLSRFGLGHGSHGQGSGLGSMGLTSSLSRSWVAPVWWVFWVLRTHGSRAHRKSLLELPDFATEGLASQVPSEDQVWSCESLGSHELRPPKSGLRSLGSSTISRKSAWAPPESRYLGRRFADSLLPRRSLSVSRSLTSPSLGISLPVSLTLSLSLSISLSLARWVYFSEK
jgi:hypothetical protein